MIRVDIESILMTSGPVPSVVVLRERRPSAAAADAPLRALSIPTGPYEAASIGHGIGDLHKPLRPIAHDLFLNVVKSLHSKVERVEINRWDDPVFYAEVVLLSADEPAEEIKLDARPCDALAVATRANAPIYVEDDIMNRAGSYSLSASELSAAEEIQRFDEFIKTVSPDDF